MLLVLTVLLLVPLGVDGGYNGKNWYSEQESDFLISAFFRGQKHAEPKIQKKKVIKAKNKKNCPKNLGKEASDPEGLQGACKNRAENAGAAAKKLHVDYLRLHYTFAADDPFNTAVGFGMSSAALGAIMPLVDEPLTLTSAISAHPLTF